jgi:hypothetical protein
MKPKDTEMASGKVETWAPNMELRFIEDGSYPHGRTLQQKWVCMENGRTEWINVPVVQAKNR